LKLKKNEAVCRRVVRVGLCSHTTQPNQTLGHVLTKQFMLSSSNTAKSHAPLEGRRLWRSRTKSFAVCSSASHAHTDDGASFYTSYLYMLKLECSIPACKRLGHVDLRGDFSASLALTSGMKSRVWCCFPYSMIHIWSANGAALLSVELSSCCTAGTNERRDCSSLLLCRWTGELGVEQVCRPQSEPRKREFGSFTGKSSTLADNLSSWSNPWWGSEK